MPVDCPVCEDKDCIMTDVEVVDELHVNITSLCHNGHYWVEEYSLVKWYIRA